MSSYLFFSHGVFAERFRPFFTAKKGSHPTIYLSVVYFSSSSSPRSIAELFGPFREDCISLSYRPCKFIRRYEGSVVSLSVCIRSPGDQRLGLEQHRREEEAMEADSWSRFSAASKRHQSAVQPRYDLYLGYEEIDGGDEDSRAEFPCPFCSEDFDIVGLCCHIDDEHPVEANNGVCPVCMARVGMDMVGHITVQHANFFKMQHRRRLRKGSSGSHSTLSLLRKDLRGGNLQSLFGGSSFTVASSNAAPDPLLSSFILTFPVADSSKDVKPESLDDGNLINNTSEEKAGESVEPSLSEKDLVERARRSLFVQELVLSTIFDDFL